VPKRSGEMGDMTNSIVPIQRVPDPVAAPTAVGGVISRPVEPVSEVAATGPRNQAADLRLVIEEDKATGAFVYKTLDRRTGEVVQQLPRDSVLKAMASEDYNPGLVVDTRD
jgi:flagellar protein FlaG